MINPFKPQKYIRVSDVMDMIAERENKLAEVRYSLYKKNKNIKYWKISISYYNKLSYEISLLRSVLKAKLKP